MIRVLTGDCRDVLAGRIKPGQHLSPATEFQPGQHWRARGKHWDRDWLFGEYVAKRRSTGDIAAELGFTDAAVTFWLRKHGIPRRSVSEARAIKHWGPVGPANPMFGRTGAANPRYVDGSSPERQRAYAQSAGRSFLAEVYKRDGYRCVKCGSEKLKPKWLHAHHIAPWAGNAPLRFDPNNAVTLCRPCHSWIHSKANKERLFLA